jgi:hypothetical protein
LVKVWPLDVIATIDLDGRQVTGSDCFADGLPGNFRQLGCLPCGQPT